MIKKRWIILVILIIMLILFMNILKPKKTYTNYLAMGDSIAEGYSLKDRNKRYSKIIQNTYKVPNNKFIDLSKSGMTAQELALNLDKNEYIDAIKNSDLITVSIGSNELLGVFTQIVQNVIFTNSTNDINAFSDALCEELQNSNSEKLFQEGISMYEKSWDEIIKKIKSINPNVTIVATEFYNPYFKIEKIGNIADIYISQLNTILHNKSENETTYYIAKIYDEFKNPEMNYTNVNQDLSSNILNLSEFDPHPNVNGHKIIAEKIEEALSKKK